MNPFRYLVVHPECLFVLNVIVGVSVIFGTAGLLALLFRRRATTVHAICLGGLLAALSLPLAMGLCDWLSIQIVVVSLKALSGVSGPEFTASNSLAGDEHPLGGLRPSSRLTSNADSQRSTPERLADSNAADDLTTHDLISEATKSNVDALAQRETAEQLFRLLALFIAVIWAFGVFFKLAKAAHGIRVITQTVKNGRRLGWEEFPELARQIKLATNASSLPTIIECNVQVPMAVGIFQPKVLLPEGLASQLRLAELRDVLVHECGHLARKDVLTAWVQLFAEAVFWFHPLVYFVSRRLSLACEELCDNLVIRNASRNQFAQLLLNLATPSHGRTYGTARVVPLQHHPPTALTFVDPRWKLEHRIRSLLDMRRSTATQVGWTRRIAVMIAFSGLAMFAATSRLESTERLDDAVGDVAPPNETQARKQTVDDQAPLDFYGDLLPRGAVARLGSVRFHHDTRATAVALSPNKPVLASSSYFGDLRVWDMNTGKQLHLLQNDSFSICALKFSPDGNQLASGNDMGKVKLWDVTAGKVLHELLPIREPGAQVISLAFSADGKKIAAGYGYSTDVVRIFDSTTGALQRELTNTGSNAVAFSPNGMFLATAKSVNNGECAIRIWNLEKDELPILIEQPHRNLIIATEFIDDGKLLLSGGIRFRPKTESGRTFLESEYELRIWDARTGDARGDLQDPENETGASIAVSADGKVLASASSKGIVIWDLPERRPVRRIRQRINRMEELDNSVDLSRDGKILAAATGKDTAVYLWDVTTGQRMHPQFQTDQDAVRAVAFDSDATHVGTVSAGIVRRWKIEGGQPLFTNSPGIDLDRGAHFSNDGSTVATLSTRRIAKDGETGRLQVWDVRAGRKLMEGTFPGEPGLATISDDKQYAAVVTGLASGDPFGSEPSANPSRSALSIWKLDTGAKFNKIPAPDRVVALWFADGSHALTVLDSTGNLQTIDIQTSMQMRSAKINMQVEETNSFALWQNALSANRKRFAFHKRSDGVHIMDLEQHKAIIVIPLSERFPHVLALSPDNQILATAPVQITRTSKTIEQSIRLWHVESGKLVGKIEAADSAISSMAFSHDGAWLVTGTTMGSTLVWNVKQALDNPPQ